MESVGNLQQDGFFVLENSVNVYQVTGKDAKKNTVSARLMCQHAQDASEYITLDNGAAVAPCSLEEYEAHKAHGGKHPEELLREHEAWERKQQKILQRILWGNVAVYHLLMGVLFWYFWYAGLVSLHEVKRELVLFVPASPLFIGLAWTFSAKKGMQLKRLLLTVGVTVLVIYLEYWPLHDIIRTWINS